MADPKWDVPPCRLEQLHETALNQGKRKVYDTCLKTARALQVAVWSQPTHTLCGSFLKIVYNWWVHQTSLLVCVVIWGIPFEDFLAVIMCVLSWPGILFCFSTFTCSVACVLQHCEKPRGCPNNAMFHQSGQMWDLSTPVTLTWLKVWSQPSVLGSWGKEWCNHCLTQVPSALAVGL